MKRRSFLSSSVALALACGFHLPAQAQVLNSSDAINKAGRQRMLSQRIAKAYLQIGMGVDLEQSNRILDASLSLFDRQLVELKNYAPTMEIKLNLLNAEKIWSSYKDILLGRAPSTVDAKKVLQASESLLEIADKVTQLLEKQANNRAGKLVNISGRQRMLSQRMAKLYQAIQWGVAPGDANALLEAARKEFNANLTVLEVTPMNTKQIQTELSLAKQQWTYFDHAIRQAPDPRMRQQYATTVATTSERILAQMDIVTGLYQSMKLD